MDVHGCSVKGEDKLQVISQWSWDYLIDYALKENIFGKPKNATTSSSESLILPSPFTSCLPGFAAEATKFLQELYCSQLEKKGG